MVVGYAELLLERRGDETEGLGPAEVEEVSEAAEEEDEPLVPAHAHLAANIQLALVTRVWRHSGVLELPVDQHALLLVQRQLMERPSAGYRALWNETRKLVHLHSHASLGRLVRTLRRKAISRVFFFDSRVRHLEQRNLNLVERVLLRAEKKEIPEHAPEVGYVERSTGVHGVVSKQVTKVTELDPRMDVASPKVARTRPRVTWV